MNYGIIMKNGKRHVFDSKEPLIQTTEEGVEFCADAAVFSWTELPEAKDEKLITRTVNK